MSFAHHPSLRVAVMHPEPVLSLGLAATLGREQSIQIGVAVADADVVVADYEAGLTLAKSSGPDRVRIVVITTACRENDIRRALACGIQGYVLLGCPPEELGRAVLSVGRGSRYFCAQAAQVIAESLTRIDLTPRESQVLQLLAQGCSNKVVARELSVAVATVKMHVKAILGKLDASSRTQAVSIATERGLIVGPRDDAMDTGWRARPPEARIAGAGTSDRFTLADPRSHRREFAAVWESTDPDTASHRSHPGDAGMWAHGIG